MSRRLRIYVAGPVTLGDRVQNAREAIDAADAIASAGYVPFVPHLMDQWHLVHRHDYEWWMRLCLEWVAACDALIRLPGESKGADREVALARELGRQVEFLEASWGHADGKAAAHRIAAQINAERRAKGGAA